MEMKPRDGDRGPGTRGSTPPGFENPTEVSPVIATESRPAINRGPPSKSFLYGTDWDKHAPVNDLKLFEIHRILCGFQTDCILILKGLNKLGYRAVPRLRNYFFGRYGFDPIHELILLPCQAKNGPRPSSMSFIVFVSPDVASVIATDFHSVDSVNLEVLYYIPQLSFQE